MGDGEVDFGHQVVDVVVVFGVAGVGVDGAIGVVVLKHVDRDEIGIVVDFEAEDDIFGGGLVVGWGHVLALDAQLVAAGDGDFGRNLLVLEAEVDFGAVVGIGDLHHLDRVLLADQQDAVGIFTDELGLDLRVNIGVSGAVNIVKGGVDVGDQVLGRVVVE